MLLFAKFVTHNYNKVITEPNHNSMRDSFMRKSGVTATLMAFLMLSFNLVADGLREALDPKMKGM